MIGHICSIAMDIMKERWINHGSIGEEKIENKK